MVGILMVVRVLMVGLYVMSVMDVGGTLFVVWKWRNNWEIPPW